MSTSDTRYCGYPRYDLFPIIKDTAPLGIVEFGAADCATLIALREDAVDCKMLGVDIDSGALTMNKDQTIDTLVLDLDKANDSKMASLGTSGYSLILMLDVIEHMNKPKEFIASVENNFPEATTMIVSVPNIRNWRVWKALACNDWPDDDTGIFDRTHKHAFTSSSLKKLFNKPWTIDKMTFRRSNNKYLGFIQSIAPSFLCGQITLVASLPPIENR